MSKYADLYDEQYYAHCADNGYESEFIRITLYTIAENLIAICRPDAVLDVGCAYNYIVEYAIEHHKLNDSLGIDISEHAFLHSRAPNNHRIIDVSESFDLGQRYDLVTCIEVAEHLEFNDALVLLDNLVRHSKKYIYFSSTPDASIPEPTHINVHPIEYWTEEFKRRGYIHYPFFNKYNIIDWGLLFLHESLIG